MTRVVVRISELSLGTGVSIATIKYYQREGLLPAGVATALRQADYGDAHVHRVRLIRTLREVGGLEIERVRRVIEAIEADDVSRHELYGVAARALEPVVRRQDIPEDVEAARAEVDAFVNGRGWDVRTDASPRAELADALVALRRLGRDYGTEIFGPYADVADRMAAWEVRTIPATDEPGVAVERMVVGTVIFERILNALRRMAQEHHSGKVHPGG
jgi:DNA-binding transcriptional MerR regulator